MNKKEKIFVADDNHESLSYISKLLKEEGYITTSADSGELALASLEHNNPDLILLDVEMPGISGFDVCRAIKKNEKLNGIPIIFLTATSQIDHKIEGLKLGAVDYITKPFYTEELMARVKTHLKLYRYNRLFKETTAETLIEKEELLREKNNQLLQVNKEYERLNEELHQNNEELKKAKNEVEQSEQKFRDFSNAVTDLYFALDQDLNYTFWNKACETALGYKQDDVIGKNWNSFDFNKGYEWVSDKYKAVLKSKKAENFEVVFELLGNKMFLTVHAYSTKSGLLVYLQDITEEKNAQKELIKQNVEYEKLNKELTKSKEIAQESEYKVRNMFENTQIGLLHFSPEGEILDVNQAALDIVGSKSIEETKKINLLAFQPFIDNGLADNILTCVKTKETVSGDMRYTSNWNKSVYLKYSLIPIIVNSKVASIWANVNDLTDYWNTQHELIKAKEKAEESEEKFKFLFDNTVQGVVYHGSNEEIIFVNEAAGRILGLTPDQMRGLTSMHPRWKAVNEDGSPYKPENHPSVISLKTGKPVYNTKMGVFIPEQERYTWININSIPKFRNNEEKPYQVVVTFEDITEIKNKTDELKKAKEKAEESEHSYISLFNSVSEAIYIQNKEGVFLDVNHGTCKMYGYRREEIIGQTPLMLAAPGKNDMSHALGLVKKAFETGNPERFEFWGKRKNGEIFPKEVITSRIKYFGKDAIITTARDITDNKTAELEILKAKEKAEENERKWTSYTKNSDDSILLIDNDLKIKYINKKLPTLTIQDVVGMSVFEFVQEEYHPVMKQVFRNVRSTKLVDGYESELNMEAFAGEPETLYFVTKVVPYIINETISGFILIASDISEKKKIELKLKESEYMWRSLTINTNDAIQIIDRDYKIQYLNKLDYGIRQEDIINTSIFKWVADEYHKTIKDTIQKVIETKTPHRYKTSLKAEVFKDQSHTMWFSVNVVPLQEQGEVKSMFLIASDITEQESIKIKLIKAKEKAEESDRLKTAFLQNMSHEIRTPLNAISGFSGRLNKPTLSDEKRKSFVSIIQNSSNHLISIVSDILTISSLETKQEKRIMANVCINEIIVELLSIFKQQLSNKNVSIYAKQELSDKQSEIRTDKTKITQILSNLLSNALKFTHEGFIEFGYALKNKELEFYVKDSGIGIETQHHDKIFERFRQADLSTNKKYGGTGLGLSISKGFVELLGGKIWVQSEPGNGSVFYFTIPYNPVNEVAQSTSPIKRNGSVKTVLVAEDEEYNFLFIEELLNDLDFDLIHAKDGKETVEICKSNPKIDLVLMDIKMPVMNGYDAAKLIKEFKPDLPIIAQSAYALEQEIEKYSVVFDDYITKPIAEDILIEKVTKYMIKK